MTDRYQWDPHMLVTNPTQMGALMGAANKVTGYLSDYATNSGVPEYPGVQDVANLAVNKWWPTVGMAYGHRGPGLTPLQAGYVAPAGAYALKALK